MARLDELASLAASVQTATLVKAVPRPAEFTYELKWDGYRIVAAKAERAVRLVTRNGLDYTKELPDVARAVAELDARELALDGEVCALDEHGVPSFQRLQNRGRRATPLVYVVFDLLSVDGEDLRERPIEERRARLAGVVGEGRGGRIAISSAVDGDPKAILAVACSRGLEGIVAKQKGSRYAAGRSPTWLKIKCKLRQELAIVGWLPLLGHRRAVGGLVLAYKDPADGLCYAGKVGTGFDDRTRVELARALESERSEAPTASGVPAFGGLVRFVVPRLVAEIEFTEWTEGGRVRQASFQGLRPDKTPDECLREVPVPVSVSPGAIDRPVVQGVRISNADRVLDPTGLTKLELARYYEAIGPRMLPHVAGRPLTLLRWAEGERTEKGGVYLRHARAWGPDVLRRVRIAEKKKTGEYLVADTVAALVGLAQMDILEIHTWNATVDDVERPDRVVFDLDPAPDVPWKRVAEAAHLLRARLEALGLASFPKTTGGKGLHVVVPLVPEASWDQCLAFTRGMARILVREDPRGFVDVVPKHTRRGKILVDYLRNNRGNTSVAAFSTRARRARRAREGAPVSVPLGWDEVGPAKLEWTVRDVLERKDDPWATYFRVRQRLPGAMVAPPETK